MVDNIVTMFDQVQIPDSSKREKEMGKNTPACRQRKGGRRERGEREAEGNPSHLMSTSPRVRD